MSSGDADDIVPKKSLKLVNLLGKNRINFSDEKIEPEKTLPKKSSKGQAILDENEYVDALDGIIERDFFPDLPKIRTQVEYLDAVDKGDLEAVHEKVKQYRLIEDFGSQVKPGSAFAAQKLDEFQAKHISEDDYSFSSIIESENSKKRAKFDSFFKSDSTNTSRARIYSSETGSRNVSVDGTEKNMKLLPHSIIAGDSSSNRIEMWKHEPRNSLMFTPNHVANTQTLPHSGKQISHSSTRFQRDLSEKPYNSNSSAINLPYKAYSYVEYTPAIEDETPEFTFGRIASTPKLLDDENISDIKTSSNLEIDIHEKPVYSHEKRFKFLPPSNRDALSKALGDRASRSLTQRKKNSSITPIGGRTPSDIHPTRTSSSVSLSGSMYKNGRSATPALSPAARQLMKRARKSAQNFISKKRSR